MAITGQISKKHNSCITAGAIQSGTSGGSSGPTLAFHAATFDPTSFEAQAQLTGTSTPTFSVDGGLLLPDHENVYRTTDEDTAPWHGARRVRNELPQSEVLDSISWAQNNVSIVGGKADPDGGTGAYEITADASNAPWYEQFANPIGTEGTVSMWLRRVSGTGAVSIRHGLSAGGAVAITSELTSSWKRFSVVGTAASVATQRVGLTISVLGDAVEVYAPQFEIVTGQSNQNPGEYVPTSGAAASAYYANENGNTASSNVVTEATGTALTEAPSLYSAPDYTNLVLNSNDATTGWTISSTSVTNVAGLQGGASDGTRVTAASSGNNRRTASAALVIGAGNNTFRVFAKAGNTDYFQIRTASFDSTLATWFNITAGTVGTSQHTVSGIRDAGGGWFECMVEVNSQTDTSGFLELIVANADNSAASVIGEYFDFGNAECYVGKTIGQIKGAAPIITAGATVGVARTEVEWDIANGNNTQGGWFFEAIPLGAIRANRSLFGLSPSFGSLLYPRSGSQVRLRAVNTDISYLSTKFMVDQDRTRFGIAYETGGDMSIRDDAGVWEDQSGFTDFVDPLVGPITFETSPDSGPVLIRDIRRYDGTNAECKTVIDGLML